MKRWLALLLLGAPLLAQEGQIPTGGNAGVTAIPFATAPLNPAAIVGADFTCASTTPVKNVNVTCTDASSGTPTSWLWSFGDGATSTSQNPVHAYADPGTYSVSLTATNRGGSNAKLRSGYIVVSDVIAPVAAFSGTPLSGTAALSVTFTDASTNTPTSWAWDFGDGVGTSSAQNPTYAYPVSGTFTVTLTATNAAGSDAEVKTGYVSVSSSLISGLLHRWSFDESSGNRADSVGSAALTPVAFSSVWAGTNSYGPTGNVPNFNNVNRYFSSTTVPVTVGAARTIAFWFRDPDEGHSSVIATVAASLNSGDRLFDIIAGGNTPNKTLGGQLGVGSIGTAGFFSAGEWVLGILTYDGGTAHKLYVNGNNLAATATRADAGGAALFTLGTSAAGLNYGQTGPIGIWNAVISTTVMDSLFNSGVAKNYADLTAAEKVGLTNYWNLTTDGTDSAGGNTLTNVNSVPFIANPAPGAAHGASGGVAAVENFTNATVAHDLDATMAAQGFSVAFWAQLRGAADDVALSLGKTSASGGTGLLAVYLNAGLGSIIVASDDTSQILSSSAGATDTSKHCYVATYDPSDKKMRLYRDAGAPGVTAGLTNHPSFATGDNAKLFVASNQGGGPFFGGWVDEPLLYNRVVTGPEITRLCAGAGNFWPFVGIP